MMPPSNEQGRSFRELFEDPEGWKETRSRIDVLAYADHWLDKQFTDAELRAWLPQLDTWGVKLGLEVGAVKPWGITGEKTFNIERKKWDRFIAAGAHIYALAMDEPLAATRSALKKPPEYAVEETARFIALVRKDYPETLVGDIEPYPFFQTDELVSFIDALQARLRQMNVRGLDFFRLDVDWMHFRPGDAKGREGWRGVRKFEMECHKRGLPFSLIYWAADYPSLKRLNRATDETWDASIVRQGHEYSAAGGLPDEYVIESWLDTPAHAVPETTLGTFTQSVLDFSRRFLGSRGN